MRRLAPAAGAALVVTSVAALAYLSPSGGDRPRTPDGGRVPAAAGEVARAAGGGDDPAARRLLERAATAPERTAYDGTQYVAAWTGDVAASRVLRVAHAPGAGTTWRSGGAAGADRAALHTEGAPTPSLLDAGAVGLIADHYALVTSGQARVAGRDTDVVDAWWPSGPLAARFWLDRETGLVLRREVYDRRGQLSRASAYVDVTLRPVQRSAGTAGDAWLQALGRAEVRRLRDDGWTCPAALPGPLPLVDARRDAAHGGMVHLSYADGISALSVFEQRGELDEDRLARLDGYRRAVVAGHPVWLRDEVPQRAVWAGDGLVYTVVADAPRRTVRLAVARLQASQAGRVGGPGDTLDRIGRGLDRVGSWFTPWQ